MRALTCAVVLAIATPASADIFKLYVEADTGTVVGKTWFGDQPVKDAAFFVNAPPFAYGLLVGAHIVFIDAWVQHHEFTNGDRVATWTQLGLGNRFQVGLNDVFLEVGLGVVYGLGTGQQVTPPPDGAKVTDQAILAEARAGVGYHLNGILDLGIAVPLSGGIFFKSGPGSSNTDLKTYYGGIEGEALFYVRANLGIL
jgi:hypothetical protein